MSITFSVTSTQMFVFHTYTLRSGSDLASSESPGDLVQDADLFWPKSLGGGNLKWGSHFGHSLVFS